MADGLEVGRLGDASSSASTLPENLKETSSKSTASEQ